MGTDLELGDGWGLLGSCWLLNQLVIEVEHLACCFFYFWADVSEIAQWVYTPITKPEDWSWIPRIHVAKGENQLSFSLHKLEAYLHTFNKEMDKRDHKKFHMFS